MEKNDSISHPKSKLNTKIPKSVLNNENNSTITACSQIKSMDSVIFFTTQDLNSKIKSNQFGSTIIGSQVESNCSKSSEIKSGGFSNTISRASSIGEYNDEEIIPITLKPNIKIISDQTNNVKTISTKNDNKKELNVECKPINDSLCTNQNVNSVEHDNLSIKASDIEKQSKIIKISIKKD